MNHMQTAINSHQDHRIQLDKRNAYHQAGHAAAIYFANKHKQLPAVHFQILIKQQDDNGQQIERFAQFQDKYTAKVEGGRLIQSLPLSFAELIQDLPWPQQEQFRCAFEADVINMLVGSLAEAKYVALQDDEAFNTNLVNIAALHYYGGDSEIELVTEYMACFMADKAERDQKLGELYLAAYNFINQRSNWCAISALADYIRDEPRGVISCEDIISLLKSRLVA